MRKLFFAFLALLVMSSCSTDMSTLSCSNTTTSNGVTTKTKYDIDYQKEDVKKLVITYDYVQDNTNNATANNNTDSTTNSDAATNNNGSRNATNNTAREKQDGVGADTDGNSKEKDSNGNLKSDDVVDGVVGDAIDSTIDGVTNTILDLAGIRSTYENQMNTYGNIEGFSYKVDKDLDNEYKVIYTIDMDKISDKDLSTFNIPSKKFSDLKKNYMDLGYTCK